MTRGFQIVVLGGALFAFSTLTEASVFDFGSASVSGSGFGNTLTLTDDGVTATLTGWGIGGGAGGTFSSAQVNKWSTGLGNCNMGEGTNCPSGPHAADNVGQIDVFFMTFSQSILAQSAMITAWEADYDVSYWGGTGAFSISGKTIADLGSRFDSDFGGTASIGNSMRTVDLTELGTEIDWIAIGARANNPDGDDRFKLKSMVFSVPQVPEPAVLGLIAFGLALAATRRRR